MVLATSWNSTETLGQEFGDLLAPYFVVFRGTGPHKTLTFRGVPWVFQENPKICHFLTIFWSKSTVFDRFLVKIDHFLPFFG